MNVGDPMYRYDSMEGFDPPVYLSTYLVASVTPKGCWLDVYGEKRFVLSEATKRFAYPTKELALSSFVARKRRHISILEAQLEHLQTALDFAQHHVPNPPPLLLT